MVFNTGPYTVLPDNSVLITANMQSETGFPSSHQLKSYVASKSRLKLAARAVLSADAGLLVKIPDIIFYSSVNTSYKFLVCINRVITVYVIMSSTDAIVCTVSEILPLIQRA